MNPTYGFLRYYFPPTRVAPETLTADLCVLGGNSAGVAAAVAAHRAGLKVIVLEPGRRLGGLSAGGLGWTDFGKKECIGGISGEFYSRAGKAYGVPQEWHFEPHVAEGIFEDFVRETQTTVYREQSLASIEKSGARIVSITTESGRTVRAKMFIDASYEGDLMARAGVSFTVGRESNRTYKETKNGAQVHETHQFDVPVSPYVIADKPESGLLPGIEPGEVQIGEGDSRIQAYNFRLCLTDNPDNRIPFAKPAGYDPAWYELLGRYFATGWDKALAKFTPIRGRKTDTNNYGAVSSDFIGQNYAFPTAGYAERERIFQAHVTYTQGWLWFLANDPRVPESVHTHINRYGYARDEFKETGGFPPQLYIREARRMIADLVMTEHHCTGRTAVEDAVGMGSYMMDSHNCRRFVRDGRVMNEGDAQIKTVKPYSISYRSIVPKRGECENLLVPVCLSASHISYGSIRMEPVLMALSESAAIAASLAIAGNTSVQDVHYDALHDRLRQAGQILFSADFQPVS